MCSRFVQHLSPRAYAEIYGVGLDAPLPNAPARWNVAPTDSALVLRRHPQSGALALSLLRWGLVPVWSKDASGAAKLINARAETVTEKPSFRDAWAKRRRCVVPADGFYEWTPGPAGKVPHFITLSGGAGMALAGLWEGWKDPASGEWLRTFTLLTCAANAAMAPLHARMPVILAHADIARFLDDPDPRDLLAPSPAALDHHPVDPAEAKPGAAAPARAAI